MTFRTALILVAAAAWAAPGQDVHITGERRLSLNDTWRFQKGDPQGAEQPAFSDGSWRQVRLPHDWAIEGPFDRKINPHEGA